MPPSSTAHTSSALPASTSSSANASTSSPDPRNAAIGAVLGVAGLILLVGIVFITVRKRRRQQSDGEKPVGPFQGTAVLDKGHPAARIVPFGTPGTEGHFFRKSLLFFALTNAGITFIAGHAPGQDMRIAIRRPDGAWDFTDPSEPFTPTGVSEIHPSPTSSSTNLIPNSRRQKGSRSTRSAVMEYKEQESRVSRMIRLGYDERDNDLGMSDGPLPHPPPAYGQEPTVGPYVTYRPPDTRDPSRNTSS